MRKALLALAMMAAAGAAMPALTEPFPGVIPTTNRRKPKPTPKDPLKRDRARWNQKVEQQRQAKLAKRELRRSINFQ